MEPPGRCGDWLAPPPSPPRAHAPGRHDERGVGTFTWPPAGTYTWPSTRTFPWPWTRGGDHLGDNGRVVAVPERVRYHLVEDAPSLRVDRQRRVAQHHVRVEGRGGSGGLDEQ